MLAYSETELVSVIVEVGIFILVEYFKLLLLF